MNQYGREIVLKSLVGSWNYNLNTPESDKDFKVFVCPTFEELYYGQRYQKTVIGEEEDLDIHDVRKLSDLLFKANINYLEALASVEFCIPNGNLEMKQIYNMRDDIFRMNLPYFFNACQGMFYQKMKLLTKGTEGTQHLVDKYGYDCYTNDTEFLTSDGWKNYDDISENELLATINLDTKAVEFQSYFNKIKKNHNGVVYELDNVYTNALVTGNHRMLVSEIKNRNKNGITYKEEYSNWHYETMENLINSPRSFYHVLNTPKPNQKDYNILDSYLNLLGLYVSEGTMNKKDKNGNYRSIRISQTSNGKNEVFDIMDSMPVDYGFKRYDYDKETVWVSHNRDIVSKLFNDCGHKDKRLPKWSLLLSKRQLDILINSLYLGDGTRKKVKEKDYGIVYYTNSRKLAGDIQALALLSNRDSLVWGGDNGYESISNFTGDKINMYQVYIKDGESIPKCVNIKRFSSGLDGFAKGVKEYEYNGDVVCFSVPNGNLITRRNGKVAIQGNCKQAQHALRSLKVPVDFAKSNFKNFEEVIKYEGEELKLMQDIRNGKFTVEEFTNMVEKYKVENFDTLGGLYKEQPVNLELKEKIDTLIMQMIKRKLLTSV